MENKRQIIVIGTGYVGLSLATLLALLNKVIAVDIIKDKVDKINNRVSPIKDQYIEEYFKTHLLDLTATTNADSYYNTADFFIIATPTNYDISTKHFDTSTVEKSIEHILSINPDAWIVIKSTIPIGFTKKICDKFLTNHIMFSPEFLRESKALEDNLYPSRIIVSYIDSISDKCYYKAIEFSKLLYNALLKKEVPIMIINTTEAEAIKLFANTYLALRVSYFNELDTYAEVNNLNTKDIIEGICHDPRIGNYYNNPSFGYGGYCLPKDTKQLLDNYKGTPLDLISAIVTSNETRKRFIANTIIKLALNKNITPKVGIYRLIMKANSDNFRCAAICDIMKMISDAGILILIYEPTVSTSEFEGYHINNDFLSFINDNDIVIANRMSDDIIPYKDKIFTRDLFGNN